MREGATLADLETFDDEVAALIRPHLAPPREMLDSISAAIAERRNEAKTARASSGIETIWRECEEAYVGIDDANRGEFGTGVSKWTKPQSPEGPVTTTKTVKTNTKSTVFVRLTARYVDAGAAKLAEILLPADDKAFSFSETPVPELVKAKDDNSQVVSETLGPLTRPAMPGEVPAMTASPSQPAPATTMSPTSVALSPAAAPPSGLVLAAGGAAPAPAQTQPPQVPLTVGDLAKENIEIARKAAKGAETRIYDWMVECQYTSEMRKVIFDAARLGVGVVKGPFPKAKRAVATSKGKDGDSVKVTIVDKVIPASKWCDPWRIYPDPACGENIHDGDFMLEEDFLSERMVRDLKKLPGYIGSQIDLVLEQGPDKSFLNTDGSRKPEAECKKGRYSIWYYYGALKRDELACIWERAGKKVTQKELPASQNQVYAIVTLINDTVVRATLNPLDSGAFPYHSMPWQRRAGSWAGIGVGEQCRVPQRMLNASTRAMLNNAGKSAGSQIVVDHASIKPANGSWDFDPDKIWYKTGDSPGDDVRKSFFAVEIPNMTPEMMTIVEYSMRLAEESTSIPLITQGQSGPTTPDTFGAAQLQNNNANQLLRSVGYSFDDNITEPLVRQYYEWLLLDPDVPDEEKGDFNINAHGSVALVERAIQDQTIAQMSALVLDPRYGFDPKKWGTQYVKSKRMAPEDFQYTKEEQEKLDSQPPPKAPAVEVAEIRAAVTREELAKDDENQDLDRKLENDHLLAEKSVELELLRSRERLAMLDYANRNQMNLDQVKKDLAKTTMTLQTQERLAGSRARVDLQKNSKGDGKNGGKKPAPAAPRPAPQVARPLAEPPQRAPDGEAFTQ